MKYNEQLSLYISRCEDALSGAVERLFQPGSIVSQAAEYSIMNGGKRVRGVLVQAICDMLGGDPSVAASFSASIEMIHAFSLIHDDLPCMDDDDLRRGKPATHIQFGEANALLAGDLLALEAPRVIYFSTAGPQQRLLAMETLLQSSGASGMIYGQELDLKYENSTITPELLDEIHVHKTGALICAAAKLGIIASGEKPAGHIAITDYARSIGIVFQIVDDILDQVSSEDVLGKPVGSDAKSGKSTYVTLHGLDAARRDVERLTTEAVSGVHNAYGDKAIFLKDFAEHLANRIN